MGKGTIILVERWRGSRGGVYYYVREGNTLWHISRYAIRRTRASARGLGLGFEYLVPVDAIKDKEIYMFKFTNRGYLYAVSRGIEIPLSVRKLSENLWIVDYGLTRRVSEDELRKLQIGDIRDPRLKKRISELRNEYAAMIGEVKDFAWKLGLLIAISGERVSEVFDDPDAGYFACLVLPDDESRLKCLETPMKWIYQLWVAKLACESLGVSRLGASWVLDKLWYIKQGSPTPAFTVVSPMGEFSFWFELQLSEGALAGRRASARPDIVISRGRVEHVKELSRIDVLIECKNEEPEYWEQGIREQLESYLKLYKPATTIVASMKRVPFKENLERLGAKVVDGLAPGNTLSIEEFKRLIAEALHRASAQTVA